MRLAYRYIAGLYLPLLLGCGETVIYADGNGAMEVPSRVCRFPIHLHIIQQ